MSDDSLPPWDEVLSAAARLQTLVPDAVLVGGDVCLATSQAANEATSRVVCGLAGPDGDGGDDSLWSSDRVGG